MPQEPTLPRPIQPQTSQAGVFSVSVSSGGTSEENKRPPSTNHVCIRVSWKSASLSSTSYPEFNLAGPYDGGRTVGQPGVLGIAVEYVYIRNILLPPSTVAVAGLRLAGRWNHTTQVVELLFECRACAPHEVWWGWCVIGAVVTRCAGHGSSSSCEFSRFFVQARLNVASQESHRRTTNYFLYRLLAIATFLFCIRLLHQILFLRRNSYNDTFCGTCPPLRRNQGRP